MNEGGWTTTTSTETREGKAKVSPVVRALVFATLVPAILCLAGWLLFPWLVFYALMR